MIADMLDSSNVQNCGHEVSGNEVDGVSSVVLSVTH